MATSSQIPQVLRFDGFELDVRAGELRKKRTRLRLQGQPLQVLAALLRHPGDLVTREELRAEIWPADTFVDFDHSLHNAISRLREVLGDSAETPRYIETLPRRGYRFIGAVEAADVAGAAEIPPAATDASVAVPSVALPSGAVAPAAGGRARQVPAAETRSRAVVLAALLLIAVVAAVLVPMLSHRATAVPVVRSIAVLPLDNF